MQNLRTYPHSAFHIELKNGESYIIDAAGAQFGFYDAVIPYDCYFKTLAKRIRNTNPLGHVRKTMHMYTEAIRQRAQMQGWLVGSEGPDRARIAETEIYAAVLAIQMEKNFTHFEAGIDAWTETRKVLGGPTLQSMALLPKKAFDAEQARFIEITKGSLQCFKREEEAKPLLRPEVAEALQTID